MFENDDRFDPAKAIQLAPQDLRRVELRIPRDLSAVMQNDRRVLVAGGLIRAVVAGEAVSDVDVFTSSSEGAEALVEGLLARRGLAVARSGVVVTPNARTILPEVKAPGLPIQVVTRWTFADAAALLADFDFSVACAAVWCEDGKWQSLAHHRFYVDLAARRLTYLSPPKEAGGSLLRLQRFAARGYRASAFQVTRIVQALASESFASASEAELREVARKIREVDPSTADGWEELVGTVDPSA